MKYGYARVSTKQQVQGNSFEDQERLLRDEGCEVIVQEQFTGTKMARPKFDELIRKLKPGDTLVVTKLDRMARTAGDGINLARGLLDRGIKIHVLNMGLIADNPNGHLILAIMNGFAEFERDMIIERTQAGKAIARTKAGFRDGRPPKYTQEQLDHAMEMLKDNSYTTVERITGISKSTLLRKHRAFTTP